MRALASQVMVGERAGAFALRPDEIFERRAPLEVELGAGKGEFIIARATAHPERNFLAVELALPVAHVLAARCARAGAGNLRVARMDARTLVNLMLADQSVDAYHIYFPDPWPKDRHAKHRMFTATFARNLARTLKPGGAVHVATDVGAYAERIFHLLESAGLRRAADAAPGEDGTGYARKYGAAGKRVFAATFVRDLGPAASAEGEG